MRLVSVALAPKPKPCWTGSSTAFVERRWDGDRYPPRESVDCHEQNRRLLTQGHGKIHKASGDYRLPASTPRDSSDVVHQHARPGGRERGGRARHRRGGRDASAVKER